MTAGLYAYGVIEASALGGPLDVAGLDPEHPVSIFPIGELAAIVSEVEISEFEGEELESNLARPEWLEAKVRAHERVLDAAIERTTVVPMRFGSIFSSPDTLESMLSDHREDLTRSLDLVRGKAEWGVKVHYQPEETAEQLVGTTPDAATGRDYLVRKKEELRAVEEASALAQRDAEEIHAQLERVADQAALTQPVGPANRNVILSAAYLVVQENREAFMESVGKMQQEHAGKYMFEVTGPWPPYNFTSVDVGGPRS
jgi:hypothetical protein